MGIIRPSSDCKNIKNVNFNFIFIIFQIEFWKKIISSNLYEHKAKLDEQDS